VAVTREAQRSALTRVRQLMVAGAATAAAGVALAGTVSNALGGVFLLAGWLALVVAIHRFGRAGRDGDDG
jgi:hypothetical protein